MSLTGRVLFADEDLGGRLTNAEVKLREIIKRAAIKGLGPDEAKMAIDAFFGKVNLEPPRLQENKMSVSSREVEISGDAIGNLAGVSVVSRLIEHRVEIPLEGNPCLLLCKPTMAPSRAAPKGAVENNSLVLVYRAKPGGEPAFESEHGKDIEAIKGYLKRVEREVRSAVREMKELAEKNLKLVDASRAAVEVKTISAPRQENRSDASLHFGAVTFTPGAEGGFKDGQPERIELAVAPAPYVPPPIKDGPQTKYIVELDLFCYSDICREIEASLGTRAVQVINQHIRDFVAASLERLGARPEQFPILSTGDGAILAFDDAAIAVRFAENVHLTADNYNAGKKLKTARRHFRSGVTKGEIVLERELTSSGELKGYTMAGSAIAAAVRLEAAGKTGEILIDEQVFRDLSPDLQSRFGPPETVKGKRAETFIAHRRKVAEPAIVD